MWVQSLGQEDSPGVGNDNALQYSCMKKSMDRGAWWAIVHGTTKSQTQLSMHALCSKKGKILEFSRTVW